jgi:L-asparaginase/Glu-tRNA(Gln) amidotransferase subunit D
VYTGNGDLLKAMRSTAASVGANGIVINSLGATHATVKVIGAAVGSNDAERKGQAIAIWMPSDTARVREACGK